MKKRKILEIAAAIVGALCLWLYVVTVVTPDDDIIIEDIPITFAGENILRTENNLILTNRSARTVSVKFHGSRLLLKQLEEEKSSITAVLDVSMFTSERDYSSGYDVIFPASLQDGRIQMVECTPKTVQFTVERLVTKTIKVKGLFDGTLASGYVAGDLIYSQDAIKVSGPADLVEQVNYAQVLIGGKDVKSTMTKDVALTIIDKNGDRMQHSDLTLSAVDVQVTMPVYLEKVLELTVTPLFGAAATTENTQISVFPSHLTVYGDPAVLEDMSTLSLGTLDLTNVLSEEYLTFEITPPTGIYVPVTATEATVYVSFTGLEMLPLEVKNISVVGVAEQFEAIWEDPSIMITLRGPSQELEALQDSQVTVTADLTQYRNTGLFSVPVSVSTGSDSIASIGSYTVLINITEKAVEAAPDSGNPETP